MKKKVFKYFTVMQYNAEEEYLRAMHKSGWKFVKTSGFRIYYFEQCEPQDVVYRIDYNKDGLYHKDEYVQIFNDCGWEYIQDFVGYSYFRKPASDESDNDDIFCDDESRLQMVSRVFKGRLLPLLFWVFIVSTRLIISIYDKQFILAIIYAAILILCFAIFACFGIQYRKFKNKLK